MLFDLFAQWVVRRRENRRYALIAEITSLVIQQHGSVWTRSQCVHCQLPIADTANFCQMCGTSQPQQPPAMPEPLLHALFEQSKTTGPIVNERPFLQAVRLIRPDVGLETERHRATHWKGK